MHWVSDEDPDQPLHAYWITRDPATGQPTGLDAEPDLSHPHNVFLHVWVSIGVFGLLAFLAVLVLFYWTFARLLRYLALVRPPEYELLRWLLVGIGAAMLAALVQGQVDSAFLEQDLAFCFWILVASLLLVRAIVGMPWRFLFHKLQE
jgi:O-antigen ligase